MTTLTIAIIALIIMIIISTIQTYRKNKEINEQEGLIDEFTQVIDYQITKIDTLKKEVKSLDVMLNYRYKRIEFLEKKIAKLTGDKKILRGRKLSK